jgi:hypothetical protein
MARRGQPGHLARGPRPCAARSGGRSPAPSPRCAPRPRPTARAGPGPRGRAWRRRPRTGGPRRPWPDAGPGRPPGARRRLEKTAHGLPPAASSSSSSRRAKASARWVQVCRAKTSAWAARARRAASSGSARPGGRPAHTPAGPRPRTARPAPGAGTKAPAVHHLGHAAGRQLIGALVEVRRARGLHVQVQIEPRARPGVDVALGRLGRVAQQAAPRPGPARPVDEPRARGRHGPQPVAVAAPLAAVHRAQEHVVQVAGHAGHGVILQHVGPELQGDDGPPGGAQGREPRVVAVILRAAEAVVKARAQGPGPADAPGRACCRRLAGAVSPSSSGPASRRRRTAPQSMRSR